MITLFTNVISNNQKIQNEIELIEKLELSLNNSKIAEKTLSIFIYYAINGKNLKEYIISKIFYTFLDSKD